MNPNLYQMLAQQQQELLQNQQQQRPNVYYMQQQAQALNSRIQYRPQGNRIPPLLPIQHLPQMLRDRQAWEQTFLKALNQFQIPATSLPAINGKTMDMYSLFMYVVQLGGCDQVTKREQWGQVCKLLNFEQISNCVPMIQKIYSVFLQKFEYILLPEKFRMQDDGKDVQGQQSPETSGQMQMLNQKVAPSPQQQAAMQKNLQAQQMFLNQQQQMLQMQQQQMMQGMNVPGMQGMNMQGMQGQMMQGMNMHALNPMSQVNHMNMQNSAQQMAMQGHLQQMQLQQMNMNKGIPSQAQQMAMQGQMQQMQQMQMQQMNMAHNQIAGVPGSSPGMKNGVPSMHGNMGGMGSPPTMSQYPGMANPAVLQGASMPQMHLGPNPMSPQNTAGSPIMPVGAPSMLQSTGMLGNAAVADAVRPATPPVVAQQSQVMGPTLASLQADLTAAELAELSPKDEAGVKHTVRTYGGVEWEKLLLLLPPQYSKKFTGTLTDAGQPPIFNLYMSLKSSLEGEIRYALDVLVLYSVENGLNFKQAPPLLDTLLDLYQETLDAIMDNTGKRLTYRELYAISAEMKDRMCEKRHNPLIDRALVLGMLLCNSSFNAENQEPLAHHQGIHQVLYWTLTVNIPPRVMEQYESNSPFLEPFPALELRKNALILLSNLSAIIEPQPELIKDILWVCSDFIETLTPYTYPALEILARLMYSAENMKVILEHDLSELQSRLVVHLPKKLEAEVPHELALWELEFVVLIQLVNIVGRIDQRYISQLINLCRPRPQIYDTIRERCIAILMMCSDQVQEEELFGLVLDCCNPANALINPNGTWMTAMVNTLMTQISTERR